MCEEDGYDCGCYGGDCLGPWVCVGSGRGGGGGVGAFGHFFFGFDVRNESEGGAMVRVRGAEEGEGDVAQTHKSWSERVEEKKSHAETIKSPKQDPPTRQTERTNQ